MTPTPAAAASGSSDKPAFSPGPRTGGEGGEDDDDDEEGGNMDLRTDDQKKKEADENANWANLS